MKRHWMGWVAILGLVLGAALPVFAAEEAAKDFTLQNLNGADFKLADVLGKQTVVLNFWAAWCSTCKEELPQLADLQKASKGENAVFLGINAGDTAAKAKKFQERYAYPYTVLLDPDKSVAKLYGVSGVPQTIIIGKNGKILFRGSRPPKTLPR